MTTIAEIKCAVAAYYGLTVNQLCGPERARIYSRPRQVAMFLARKMTGRSLPEIGRAFQRDHSTVLHSLGAVSTRDDMLAEALAVEEQMAGPQVVFRTRRKA